MSTTFKYQHDESIFQWALEKGHIKMIDGKYEVGSLDNELWEVLKQTHHIIQMSDTTAGIEYIMWYFDNASVSRYTSRHTCEELIDVWFPDIMDIEVDISYHTEELEDDEDSEHEVPYLEITFSSKEEQRKEEQRKEELRKEEQRKEEQNLKAELEQWRKLFPTHSGSYLAHHKQLKHMSTEWKRYLDVQDEAVGNKRQRTE